MRLSPAPERAAAFTASTGESALARNLSRHVRQARHTANSGLSTFGEEWGDLFPSLRRSFALIHAAESASADDRARLLDRALDVVLEGTREQMNAFASQIRAPATALYAFGVLLPIALIALLPAAGAAGLSVTPLSVALLYGLLLPALCLVVSVWLLSRRPVAFPPPNVTTAHPDVPDRRPLAVGVGLLLGCLTWALTVRLAPAWGPPVAALGTGTGSALWLTYRPVISVYERIRKAESELSDAVALVGRRVANGRAVETAIARTATELDGPLGEALADGARQTRQLQIGVREAFLGEYGVLQDLPSRRIGGSMALLSLGASEGRPAGSALLVLADHVDDLRRIEQDARHSLSHVCRTLSTTGALFGPMVAGATVALADGIGTGLIEGGQSIPWLGAIVGWYVLVLAVLLPALATGLTQGLDRSLVGYRVGRSLVGATVTFFCAYLLVGLIA
jgi:Flp pilus assembly protein TadB